MRTSTLILSLALIAILSLGATSLSFYAPTTSGTSGQVLVSNGPNTAPTWLANGTAGKMLVSGGANANPTWKGTETITYTNSSYVGGGTITAKKFGNVVTINFQNFYVSSASAGMQIGTISSGKPSAQRASVLSRTNGDICLITVGADGAVKAWNMSTGSGAEYYGSITYIID